MDVLSDVLSWVRVEGTLTRRSELTAPWGIAYPPHDHVSFLLVETGRCFMLRPGHAPGVLEAGDLVMFAPGGSLSIVDDPATPAVRYGAILEAYAPLDSDRYAADRTAYPTLRYGGGGRLTAIRGWGIRFDGYARHPLLAHLPPLIHLTYAERTALPWLDTTLRFLLHETRQATDGSEMMCVRLVDLLFVQVIRAWFGERPAGEGGWLGALRDPAVGHALGLMHQYAGDPWTVGGLARAVGMSRSSFSARFQSLVGAPPLAYLTQVRMNLAAIALRSDPQVGLAEVAGQVGYDSQSSFGRAFKRHFGVSPRRFRLGLAEERSGPVDGGR